MQGRSDLHQFVKNFAGSNRYILDYLFEEVFSLQGPEVQEFLINTSILTRLTADLCNAVVDRRDSQDLLVDPRLRAAFLGAASEEKPEASRLGAAGLTNIRLEKPDMHEDFMPKFESVEQLHEHQLKGFKWTVKHAYEGSSHYRAKLDSAGVIPENINSLGDLQKLQQAIAEQAPERLRGSVIGVFTLTGAVGILIASVVGGYLFDHWLKTGPFVFFGAISALVLVWALILRAQERQPA